uniref:Uncharacterized protein n=1 Tax=Sphaerodactylus townsendi TaxID=933632 RepID=A0ACB8F6L8_9SAUR
MCACVKASKRITKLAHCNNQRSEHTFFFPGSILQRLTVCMGHNMLEVATVELTILLTVHPVLHECVFAGFSLECTVANRHLHAITHTSADKTSHCGWHPFLRQVL